MNPSLNKSFLQGQPGISYSNQTTTPTDTQSLIVSQPDQPAQPTQSAPEHISVAIPHNGQQGRRHSSHHETQSYSHRYIPEEVSYFISRDRFGNIRLTADQNKMFGLGRCLCILAILEILYLGFQSFNYFLTFQLYFAFFFLLCMIIPFMFFRGYGNLDFDSIKIYSVCRIFVIIINIYAIVMFFIVSHSKFGEKEAIQLIIYIVQLMFSVFLISFPLLLGLLGIYYREVLFPS